MDDIFKVIVSGGRDFEDKYYIYQQLDRLLANKTNILIISGECKTGVDYHTKNYAKERGYQYHGEEAEWEVYGNSAGPIRNKKMADLKPDGVICFWDGESLGTGNMIKIAKQRKIPLRIIRYQKIPKRKIKSYFKNDP